MVKKKMILSQGNHTVLRDFLDIELCVTFDYKRRRISSTTLFSGGSSNCLAIPIYWNQVVTNRSRLRIDRVDFFPFQIQLDVSS